MNIIGEYLRRKSAGDNSPFKIGDITLAGGYGIPSGTQTQQVDPNLTRAQQSMAWMQNLPGRQAAGQTGTYNGWNALADMLGAYWKVNGQGQAAQDAGFTGRAFGDGAHTAFSNAAGEVMPNTDFLNQQDYKRYF